MTCFPPWHYGSASYLFHYLLCPTFFVILIFFFLSLLWRWLLFLFVKHSFSLFFIFNWQFWLSHFSYSLSLLFSTLLFFIPTFRVITHTSHPQLMVFPWVEVHITQGRVRAKTRSVSALATLNLCFWPMLRCTCPKRDMSKEGQGQHIIPRKDELGLKRKVHSKLKSFGSKMD